MFRVRWKQSALDALAAMWAAADSQLRRAITAAVHRIDQELRIDPASKGESRPNGRRVHFEAPLGVLFQVEPQHSIVRVLRVWQY